MYVTAKLSGKIKAIKLTEELVADRGEYLVFDENDGITVLSETEFKRFFSLPSLKNGSAEKHKRASPGMSKKKRHGIDPNGAILDPRKNSPFKRCLLAFGPDVSGQYLSGLSRNKVAEILDDTPELASTALSDLRGNGFLSIDQKNGKFYEYSLTDKGRDMNVRIRRVAAEYAKKTAEYAKKNPGGVPG